MSESGDSDYEDFSEALNENQQISFAHLELIKDFKKQDTKSVLKTCSNTISTEQDYVFEDCSGAIQLSDTVDRMFSHNDAS